MMNDSNMESKGSDKSPFAPAEMYLSDMIGSNKNPHTHGDDENEGDFQSGAMIRMPAPVIAAPQSPGNNQPPPPPDSSMNGV